VIPILLYHSVSDEASPRYRRYCVTPETFAAQMAELERSRAAVLSVGALVSLLEGGSPLPRSPVVLTFDDGLRDFAAGALPILDAHRLPATLYVVSDHVGGTAEWLSPLGEGDRPMLDWDELADCVRRGIELGAHSRSHPELDTLDRDRARDEIAGSKGALERGLGVEVSTFAYPHGYNDERARALVRAAGFRSACAVRERLSHPRDDRFALARFTVASDTDAPTFAAVVRGEGLPAAPRREAARTMAWRAVRRSRARVAGRGPA
jgi:peptidoglycan/xylan/chitin deacetylase (PgdA/CDA1 family)